MSVMIIDKWKNNYMDIMNCKNCSFNKDNCPKYIYPYFVCNPLIRDFNEYQIFKIIDWVADSLHNIDFMNQKLFKMRFKTITDWVINHLTNGVILPHWRFENLMERYPFEPVHCWKTSYCLTRGLYMVYHYAYVNSTNKKYDIIFHIKNKLL